MNGYLYDTIGNVTEIQPDDGETFSLGRLQSLVGGYIQIVYLDDGKILVCDEEGRIKGKECNNLATIYACNLGFNGGCDLVGDVFFCDNNQVL